MKVKLFSAKVANLILILVISLGVSGTIYFMPQSPTIYPITPFMNYYTKVSYYQDLNGTTETSTAVTLVWLSGIVNATTIEVSERNIITLLAYVPYNFTETKTYQVNLITRETNTSDGKFLYWTFPYWSFIKFPDDVLYPIPIGNYMSYVTGEENMLVQELVRNTKTAWCWNLDTLSVANYDKDSGFLVEYKGRINNTVEIIQLKSILGVNLGINFEYYSLMILLLSLIPSLIVYFITLGFRKKSSKIDKMKILYKIEHKETEPSTKVETNRRTLLYPVILAIITFCVFLFLPILMMGGRMGPIIRFGSMFLFQLIPSLIPALIVFFVTWWIFKKRARQKKSTSSIKGNMKDKEEK